MLGNIIICRTRSSSPREIQMYRKIDRYIERESVGVCGRWDCFGIFLLLLLLRVKGLLIEWGRKSWAQQDPKADDAVAREEATTLLKPSDPLAGASFSEHIAPI
ncbi:hypothetical protein Hanom_Chr03g00191361 [Helianthus anomalus]